MNTHTIPVRQALYAAPDKNDWILRHGIKPYVIQAEERFIAGAQGLLLEDKSTINAAEAEVISDALESLCETVGIIAALHEDILIFFDGHNFIAYPPQK